LLVVISNLVLSGVGMAAAVLSLLDTMGVITIDPDAKK
jgi:uncharacterized membrane protein (Fun14 family)